MDAGLVNRVIQEISDVLFQRVRSEIAEIRLELIKDNHALGGLPQGFLFGGALHHDSQVSITKHQRFKMLHPSLYDRARAYMQEAKHVEDSIPQIKRGLFWIASECADLQDFRDMLPNSIVNMSQQLKSLPRTRPPGFLFENKPLSQKTFEDFRLSLEDHASAHFL